jgi:hypothetical protein
VLALARSTRAGKDKELSPSYRKLQESYKTVLLFFRSINAKMAGTRRQVLEKSA